MATDCEVRWGASNKPNDKATEKVKVKVLTSDNNMPVAEHHVG